MSEDLVGASGGVLDDVVAAMGGTPREGQASMAAEAAMAIEERRHLMVQAGTGTGKSIGYLTPLLTHCALNGVRGLVSTATLALQRQILVKDAPAVVDAVAARTGVRLDVRVLKGWSVYRRKIGITLSCSRSFSSERWCGNLWRKPSRDVRE